MAYTRLELIKPALWSTCNTYTRIGDRSADVKKNWDKVWKPQTQDKKFINSTNHSFSDKIALSPALCNRIPVTRKYIFDIFLRNFTIVSFLALLLFISKSIEEGHWNFGSKDIAHLIVSERIYLYLSKDRKLLESIL